MYQSKKVCVLRGSQQLFYFKWSHSDLMSYSYFLIVDDKVYVILEAVISTQELPLLESSLLVEALLLNFA